MPGSIRLFVPEALRPGLQVAASPGQARYLGTVMRRAVGDRVRLFNGTDGEWSARIVQLGRDRAVLAVQEQLREQAPDGPDIWLAFALLKRDATDLVVQKATELGASAILPTLTERTNAARVNHDRLIAIATEASEQSERLSVPDVREPMTLDRLLARWPSGRTLFAAIERSEAPLLGRADGPAALLVGPEGGWTEHERRTLLSQDFVAPVSVGRLVLRAETACLAGLVLLQAGQGP